MNSQARLALLVPMFLLGLLFAAVGTNPIVVVLLGALAVLLSNKFAYGAWKTTPWGDLW